MADVGVGVSVMHTAGGVLIVGLVGVPAGIGAVVGVRCTEVGVLDAAEGPSGSWS